MMGKFVGLHPSLGDNWFFFVIYDFGAHRIELFLSIKIKENIYCYNLNSNTFLIEWTLQKLI